MEMMWQQSRQRRPERDSGPSRWSIFVGVARCEFAFDPEYALPNAAYRDPVLLDAEMARIWRGDWVFAITEDAVPAPGDQFPVVIGNQPVLILRNQEGGLSALSNLCAHRGTLLVDRPTNDKRIQCPYHAWTYREDGRLLSAPYAPTGTIDRETHCLPVYRAESWHGLVFVSLNPDVEPLGERFSSVEPLVTARGIDRLRHWPDRQEADVWNCNWKLAMMNAMESYHLFKVHPKTLQPYTPTQDAYYITGSARATATGGKTKGQDDYLLVSLPPGFVGVLNRDSFLWQSVHPIDTHCCAVRTGSAFASRPQAGSLGGLVKWITRSVSAIMYSSPDFLPEDKAICERGQRGASGDFVPGQLVPMEKIVADFGHYLNWRLNDVEPPPPQTGPNP